jgi:hypothetical protein
MPHEPNLDLGSLGPTKTTKMRRNATWTGQSVPD